MDETAAKDYLVQHNNYFKLTAYRKNYDKHSAGENSDKYINLEFAYLVDIAVIDMYLRYRIVHMALDIEHHTKHRTNSAVTKALMTIPGMNSNFRKNRMSNARIQQIVTLFYMHKTMVESDGIIESESKELHKIIDRIHKHYSYYDANPMIKGTFDFLKFIVDSWFGAV